MKVQRNVVHDEHLGGFAQELAEQWFRQFSIQSCQLQYSFLAKPQLT
jgi:hypothetical protein